MLRVCWNFLLCRWMDGPHRTLWRRSVASRLRLLLVAGRGICLFIKNPILRTQTPQKSKERHFFGGAGLRSSALGEKSTAIPLIPALPPRLLSDCSLRTNKTRHTTLRALFDAGYWRQPLPCHKRLQFSKSRVLLHFLRDVIPLSMFLMRCASSISLLRHSGQSTSTSSSIVEKM